MKKLSLLLAAVLAVPLLAVTQAGAQTSTPARGQFTMTVHSHSSGTLLFPTARLDYDLAPGSTFSYSSRLCSASAPFNDIGLNFTPDYPGVDDEDGTAANRHHVEGTVVASFGNRAVIEGTITSVLCVPGDSPNGQVESDHVLVSHFRVIATRTSDNDLQVTGSFRFSPTESTGTFAGIQGGGLIQGRFTCLAGTPTCAQRGEYTDFVASRGDPTLPAGQLLPGMQGAYFDPTVLAV